MSEKTAPQPPRRASSDARLTKTFVELNQQKCACNVGGGSRFCIYVDGHVVSRSKLLWRTSLLGSFDQLCAAFFHVEPTPEADCAELCLCAARGGQACPRKTVVCVLRVQHRRLRDSSDPEPPWDDLYVARSQNCFRGGTESNIHAERFLMADPGLADTLCALPDDGERRVVLYMTYQPCHHSGGHRRRGMGAHGTSCTEAILEYVERSLRPRGVTLELKIAYLYRAHWEEGAFHPKYQPAVEAARGLRLLASAGVRLSALTHHDGTGSSRSATTRSRGVAHVERAVPPLASSAKPR